MVQYLALADPAAAREQLANLPAEIDNGTTKSYVMAFVFSQTDTIGAVIDADPVRAASGGNPHRSVPDRTGPHSPASGTVKPPAGE